MPGSKAVPLKLIIDSGSSNAFSLYHLSHDEIMIPESRIETLIGVGLSGKVHGYLGRAQEIELGGMKFNTPIIAYPDSTSIRKAIGVGERNGSLGGEVLRRFKVIFHYPNSALYLRKNRDFDDDFNYNMSGIELNTPFPNIPFYVVSEVREDSPAAEKGVKAGDAIKYVDGERATDMNLNEMIYYLQKREGRKVQIGIQRDSLFKYISISLDNKLTVDEPRN
jgi:membrane-associated protease RseP (regulator of RpoE activity)